VSILNITAKLPVLSGEGNLAFYLREIRKYPILDPNEEYILAKSWREHGDVKAAHKLVTSHLRLVVSIAKGYRGYGLPVSELISEGSVGLMQAVKKFDPERGFRLSTYAMWWIKAAIKEYVLRSWSMVKMGTTAAQKKLFFNLSRLKRNMRAIDNGDLSPEQVSKVAQDLAVSENEVINMNRRLIGGDQSLNAPLNRDGEGKSEWQDWLVDESESNEIRIGNEQELKQRRSLLITAMKSLKKREQDIIMSRRLSDPPVTLEVLSQKFAVSRERIRQIEVRAFEKLQLAIKENMKEI